MQTDTSPSTPAYLRLADVRNRYSVSGSTIWKWAATPTTGFPKPVKLGSNTTCWKLSDLLAWEATRPQAKSGDSNARPK